MPGRLAVVGGGWAGIATAVRAMRSGHSVTVFETARVLGGRARTDTGAPEGLDNGQHILIGAYSQTLALLTAVGVDHARVFHRMPLSLRFPDGRGLQLRAGTPLVAFARAVFGTGGWNWTDRAALLGGAARWARQSFQCPPDWTVEQLCRGLTPAVKRDLIEPLCVAALNTPANAASGQVFLTVLKDAVFGGRGSSDLLLPRVPLGELLPTPAAAWLAGHGADMRLGLRVKRLDAATDGWLIDGEHFDNVVLSCSLAEAARLVEPSHPAWAAEAQTLRYEPIITVYLRASEVRLPSPIVALVEGPDDPAQFVIDHGAIGAMPGRLAFVVSGAAKWVEAGNEKTAHAVVRQAHRLDPSLGKQPLRIEGVRAERRATFRCVPGLNRPVQSIRRGLVAAGDYVQGPYPATLEGAVRSGESAIELLDIA